MVLEFYKLEYHRKLDFAKLFFFFLREFQPMTSAPDDSSLSSDQDTNQFLVQVGIEPQISYTTIKDFTKKWQILTYFQNSGRLQHNLRKNANQLFLLGTHTVTVIITMRELMKPLHNSSALNSPNSLRPSVLKQAYTHSVPNEPTLIGIQSITFQVVRER